MLYCNNVSESGRGVDITLGNLRLHQKSYARITFHTGLRVIILPFVSDMPARLPSTGLYELQSS